jgi:hypothetical protein
MKCIWALTLFLGLFLSLFATARTASATTTGVGTVHGRVFATGGVIPLSGVRVELRKGLGDQVISTVFTNSQGYFTFNNVATSANTSFHVKAGHAPYFANWYFTLAPGQTRNANLSMPFWPNG